MPTFAAEDNLPHFDPDAFALMMDEALFALLPGKRFLARPLFFRELDHVHVSLRDENGRAAKPTHIIVDRTHASNRYLRYAIYIGPSETLPVSDEECIAHLRSIGAAL
jgi:hypothetical protein